ncbi:glycoside hydrolase [Caulobacter sp. LARHSG274]
MRSRLLALAAVVALSFSGPALAEVDCSAPVAGALPVTVQADLDHPRTEFEGWGTALAWFANVTGGYPEPVREKLADLLYGPGGLGFTIARYNIGGGNPAGITPYLRPGADVPGFWRQVGPDPAWRPENEAQWDWSADPRQRWWLDAIRNRVPESERLFEAFSNSPPWFMTVSGRVSGAQSGLDNNLRPGQEALFAAYLARTVDELQRRHQIRFRTLSPVNEPNTPYWHAANRQEGSHWSPEAQERIILATDRALKARGLDTRVAAMDETNSQTFVRNWARYGAPARAAIGQLNVHGYDITGQTGVRDLAAASGIRLWMSEVDLSAANSHEDFQNLDSALALAEHVVLDLKRLEPSAWVFWQAIEDLSGRQGGGSNWGLIKMDLSPDAPADHPWHVTTKYWAMANFSRYIRPGYRLLTVDDPDTVAAVAPGGGEIVFVHVNPGLAPRALELHGLKSGAWSAETVVTDQNRRAEALCRTPGQTGGSGAPLRIMAPPRSVVTVRLRA